MALPSWFKPFPTGGTSTLFQKLGAGGQPLGGGGSLALFGGQEFESNPIASKLAGTFTDKLQGFLEKPGLTPEDEDRMVGRMKEGLAERQANDSLNLSQYASAMGFGKSGQALEGAQNMASKYAGMGLANERDIRLDAAKDRFRAGLDALRTAGGVLGGLGGRSASGAMFTGGTGALNARSYDVGGGGGGGGGPQVVGQSGSGISGEQQAAYRDIVTGGGANVPGFSGNFGGPKLPGRPLRF